MMKVLILLLCSLPLFAQHSVTLTWQWTQGTGGTETNFNVKKSTISGGPYTTISSPTTLNYIDTTGLVEGTKYYYVVTAVGPGGESANSNEANALIPFLPPVTPSTLLAVPK